MRWYVCTGSASAARDETRDACFPCASQVELSIPATEPWGVVLLLACCTAVVVTATVLSMVTAAFVIVGLLKKYRGLKPLYEASTMQEDYQSFDKFWSDNCQREYRRSLLLFTFAVPFFLANLCVISFIKFRTWGMYIGIVTSSIVGVGFVVWVNTNLNWVRPKVRNAFSLADDLTRFTRLCVLLVGFADSQVDFLTVEDAIDEYGLQPGSPSAVSSGTHRPSTPQNSPRRPGPGGGAHPAAARDLARQSGQIDLAPGTGGVDARAVGDGSFTATGVGPLQPTATRSHDVESASQGGCCGARASEPQASVHWLPSSESIDHAALTRSRAADVQPIAHVGPSMGRQAGASKAHLP